MCGTVRSRLYRKPAHRVRVALHTWSENGITQRDIALAREIESVAELN